MAAGCVPITTDYAVMKERNQGVMVKGDIHDPNVKEKFRHHLVDLLKSKKRREEVLQDIDVSSFSWDSVAKRWEEQFNV